jgi:hypothetical protein
MKQCHWCNNSFDSDVSYQIYCSSVCRDDATKEKISARYVTSKRQKRKGKNRRCKYCNEPLSIYNDENLCVKCNINPVDVNKALKEIKGNLK